MPITNARRLPLCHLWPYTSRRLHDKARRDANNIVSAGLRDGSLVRQPCVICKSKRSEAHHDNYDQPLGVTWLCRPHHRKRDKELAQLRSAGYLAEKLTRQIQRRQNLAHLNRDRALALVYDVTSQVDSVRRLMDLSYSDIAKRLGSSRQMTTSWFAGGVRTLKALSSLADALQCDVQVRLVPRDEQSSRVA